MLPASISACEGRGKLLSVLRHQDGPRRHPRPGMSAWLLVVIWSTDINTDHCCSGTTDADMAFGCSSGQTSLWSQVVAEAIPHHRQVSSCSSRRSVQTISSLPTLHQILVHRCGVCLLMARQWLVCLWVSSAYPPQNGGCHTSVCHLYNCLHPTEEGTRGHRNKLICVQLLSVRL